MNNIKNDPDHVSQASTARVGLAVPAMAFVFAVLLFVPAGRLDWTLGWIYVGLVVVFVVINWACLRRWNPELIERHMRFGERTKTSDKVWAVLYAPVMITIYVVAGLEARSGVLSLPMAVWPLGLVIFVLGSSMLIWPMVVNPFRVPTPLLLGSAWAFVPTVIAVIGIIIRTALEDRTLHAELPGYTEYTARVRYRLVPGIW